MLHKAGLWDRVVRFPGARLQKWAILSTIGQYLEETGWKPETRQAERVADGHTINDVCVWLSNAPSDQCQNLSKSVKEIYLFESKNFYVTNLRAVDESLLCNHIWPQELSG